MTIKIGGEIEATLVMRIAEGIQNTTPRYSVLSVSDLYWADEYLKDLPEDARVKIERYLGERGLSRFICAEIHSRYLSGENKVDLSSDRPLGSIPFASNSIQLARDLVAHLKQLPFRYRVTVALPKQFSEPLLDRVDKTFQLPSNISLVRGHLLPGEFPISSGDPSIDQYLFTDFIYGENDPPREIDSDRYYFTMPVLGYASNSSSSALGRNFEDNLRAFYGAGIATRLLEYSWSGDAGVSLPYIMVHSEDDRKIIETEKLEDDLLEFRWHCSTKPFAQRHKSNLVSDFKRYILKISTIFHEDIDCRRLFTACIWFYRATVNRRPLDALLEATIAIEVMLGDRKAAEGVGLSNLLGSRCAFLLGNSSKQRERIMSIFRKIYDLRSNIVHQGRHTLQAGDRATVNSALSMCGSIITKELDIRAISTSKEGADARVI